MILQLVGLPGTGKTTTAVNLSNKYKNINLRSKKEVIFWFFLYVLLHPIYTIRGGYIFFIYRPNLYSFWNYFILRNAKMCKAIFYSKNNICIIDEPPLQNMYSLVEKNLTSKDFEHIYSNLLSKGSVIFFTLDEVVRLDRVQGRGRNMKNEHDSSWNERMLTADLFLSKKLEKRIDTFFTFGSISDIEKYVEKFNK